VQYSMLALRHGALKARAARLDDLPALRQLLKANRRVHLHLDWWTLEEWLGNPACVVVRDEQRIVGLGLGARDTAEAAWLRVIAAADGLALDALLAALLPAVLAALRVQGAHQLACMAWADWLAGRLPRHGFLLLTHVVTLRKRDGVLPAWGEGRGLCVRPATAADLDCIVALDHAAFPVEWWYGGTTLWRAMSDARFVVAERAGQVVGYAFGSWLGMQAHITRVAVQPECQRQGIGARLTADLVQHFNTLGAGAITLNTQVDNAASLKLYHRLGFEMEEGRVAVYRRPT